MDGIWRLGGLLAAIIVLYAKRDRPDGEFVVGTKRCFGDRLSIDDRPVERAQVADSQQSVRLKELAMLAADHRMGNRQVCLPAPPDRGGDTQGDVGSLRPATDDDELDFHGEGGLGFRGAPDRRVGGAEKAGNFDRNWNFVGRQLKQSSAATLPLGQG